MSPTSELLNKHSSPQQLPRASVLDTLPTTTFPVVVAPTLSYDVATKESVAISAAAS